MDMFFDVNLELFRRRARLGLGDLLFEFVDDLSEGDAIEEGVAVSALDVRRVWCDAHVVKLRWQKAKSKEPHVTAVKLRFELRIRKTEKHLSNSFFHTALIRISKRTCVRILEENEVHREQKPAFRIH
jgi:hypothetical protein